MLSRTFTKAQRCIPFVFVAGLEGTGHHQEGLWEQCGVRVLHY